MALLILLMAIPEIVAMGAVLYFLARVLLGWLQQMSYKKAKVPMEEGERVELTHWGWDHQKVVLTNRRLAVLPSMKSGESEVGFIEFSRITEASPTIEMPAGFWVLILFIAPLTLGLALIPLVVWAWRTRRLRIRYETAGGSDEKLLLNVKNPSSWAALISGQSLSSTMGGTAPLTISGAYCTLVGFAFGRLEKLPPNVLVGLGTAGFGGAAALVASALYAGQGALGVAFLAALGSYYLGLFSSSVVMGLSERD